MQGPGNELRDEICFSVPNLTLMRLGFQDNFNQINLNDSVCVCVCVPHTIKLNYSSFLGIKEKHCGSETKWSFT